MKYIIIKLKNRDSYFLNKEKWIWITSQKNPSLIFSTDLQVWLFSSEQLTMMLVSADLRLKVVLVHQFVSHLNLNAMKMQGLTLQLNKLRRLNMMEIILQDFSHLQIWSNLEDMLLLNTLEARQWFSEWEEKILKKMKFSINPKMIVVQCMTRSLKWDSLSKNS